MKGIDIACFECNFSTSSTSVRYSTHAADTELDINHDRICEGGAGGVSPEFVQGFQRLEVGVLYGEVCLEVSLVQWAHPGQERLHGVRV